MSNVISLYQLFNTRCLNYLLKSLLTYADEIQRAHKTLSFSCKKTATQRCDMHSI